MKAKVLTLVALGISAVTATTATPSVIRNTLQRDDIRLRTAPRVAPTSFGAAMGAYEATATELFAGRGLPWPYYFSFKAGTVFRIDGPLSYNGCGKVLRNSVSPTETNGSAEVLTLRANIPDTNVRGYYRFMVRSYGTWKSEVWLARKLGDDGQPDWDRKYVARATRPETTTRQIEWRNGSREFFAFKFLRKNSSTEQDIEFYHDGSFWDLDIELRNAPYPGRGRKCGD